MTQDMMERKQVPHQSMTTSSSIEKKMNIRQAATMTAYLENPTIKATQPKGAILTAEERKAAEKAVEQYRQLSLEEIAHMLERDKRSREVIAQIEAQKANNHIRNSIINGLTAAAVLLLVALILCIVMPEYIQIILSMTIGIEAGFVAQILLIKGAYKK